MAQEPAPAIRTAYDERYSDIERIETIGSDTTFHRGLGETGTRVELVDFFDSTVGGRLEDTGGCPRCGETEMVLSLDLNPEGYDDAAFYCTNLKCPHFVQDAVEYDMDKIRADQPEMWDNTAECPDCGKRFTTTLKKGIHTNHEFVHPSDGDTTANRADSVEYVKGDASGGIVGDVVCDECIPSMTSEGSSDSGTKEEL